LAPLVFFAAGFFAAAFFVAGLEEAFFADALLAEVFLADFPPAKIADQPSAYFSLVPTRVMVTLITSKQS
jgi:hypothetical protein